MRARDWNIAVGLPIAALLLTGCESKPAAGPLPIRVAPALAAPPADASSPSSPAAAASGGFSLPIGGEIPPQPAPPANPNSTGQAANFAPLQPQAPTAPSPVNSPGGIAASPGYSTIHLSAGVAVPQSLPTGTVMAISVDYSLSTGTKSPSRYFWVVKSAAGEMVNEVKLEVSGNLSAFFQQLKPEHRPFSTRIEEVGPGSRHRVIISNELPLKTDY